MSKELLITLFTVVLGLVPASCLSAGCASKSESAKFAADVSTEVKAAKDLGLKADADLFLSPNGSAGLFNGFHVTNQSWARVHISADPKAD